MSENQDLKSLVLGVLKEAGIEPGSSAPAPAIDPKAIAQEAAAAAVAALKDQQASEDRLVERLAERLTPGRAAKPTPGTTPSGPPQMDKEWDLRMASAEDVARWRSQPGELRRRGDLMRQMMGGGLGNLFAHPNKRKPQ